MGANMYVRGELPVEHHREPPAGSERGTSHHAQFTTLRSARGALRRADELCVWRQLGRDALCAPRFRVATAVRIGDR
eukprot:6257978-Prymnesium_polylepis.2